MAAAFLDRDVSWLEFNRRVLHEAQDPRTPLLERVKFLAIFSSNLDEFFMKRLGLLKREPAGGASHPGHTPDLRLARIRRPSYRSSRPGPKFGRAASLRNSTDEGHGGDGTRQSFVRLLDLIRANITDPFPAMAVVDVMPFRVTRKADVEVDPDEDETLSVADQVEEELRLRRFERVVLLEYGAGGDPVQRHLLMRKLDLTAADLYDTTADLDFTDLFQITGLNRPELKDRTWRPVTPSPLAENDDIFAVIRAGDFLVHYPYESFDASVAHSSAAPPKTPRCSRSR